MRSDSAGFSLLELMVAMAIMLVISGAAVTALLKLSTTQSTIWNRTQMHSGIRGATEVLQQEVGQAGRVTLPNVVTLTNNTIVGATSLPVSSTDGMFLGEQLTVGAGTNQETVTVSAEPTSLTSVSTSATTAAHSSSDSVTVQGGFWAGVIPPAASPWNYANGSTPAVLKLFGDINGDGSMVYTEYSVSPACICTATCNPSSTSGNLYRNSMAWNATLPKLQATASQILLGNVTANPHGTACFSYQPVVSINGNVYVTDVAVTLTVQTQIIDPVTHQVQMETKALLNVSPRNVVNTSVLDGFGYVERVQPIPAKVAALLAGPS